MNRLIKYTSPRPATRSQLAAFDGARVNYDGEVPNVPGCRQHFQRRQRVEKIRRRMYDRQQKIFGADE
jgi:hypothetical protein